MGFLGQELPGSIICAECTCSHTPEPRRAAPTRLPSAAAGRVWPRGCCPPGLFPLPAQKCAPNPRVCGRSGEQPVLPVPALPAPPGWFLERCSRSCPQAGDAERSSSLLEMGSAGPQLCLLSPERVPVGNVWVIQSSEPFAAPALTSLFLPGVFSDLRST